MNRIGSWVRRCALAAALLALSAGTAPASRWSSKYGLDLPGRVFADSALRGVRWVSYGDPATRLEFEVLNTATRATRPIASLDMEAASITDAASWFAVGVRRRSSKVTGAELWSHLSPDTFGWRPRAWQFMTEAEASQHEVLVLVPDVNRGRLLWASTDSHAFRECGPEWLDYLQDVLTIPDEASDRHSALAIAAQLLAEDRNAKPIVRVTDGNTPSNAVSYALIAEIGGIVVPFQFDLRSSGLPRFSSALSGQLDDSCVRDYLESLRIRRDAEGTALWRMVLEDGMQAGPDSVTSVAAVVFPAASAPVTPLAACAACSAESRSACPTSFSGATLFMTRAPKASLWAGRAMVATAEGVRPTWMALDLPFLPATPSPALALASLAAASTEDARILVAPKDVEGAILLWRGTAWGVASEAGPLLKERPLWTGSTTMAFTGSAAAPLLKGAIASGDSVAIHALLAATRGGSSEPTYCDYLEASGANGSALVLGSVQGTRWRLEVWRPHGWGAAQNTADLRFVEPDGGTRTDPHNYSPWRDRLHELLLEDVPDPCEVYVGRGFLSIANPRGASHDIRVYQKTPTGDRPFRRNADGSARVLSYGRVVSNTQSNTSFRSRVEGRRVPTLDETLRGCLASPSGWRALGWYANPLGLFDL